MCASGVEGGIKLMTNAKTPILKVEQNITSRVSATDYARKRAPNVYLERVVIAWMAWHGNNISQAESPYQDEGSYVVV
jgi:hypothetical protein